MAITLCPLQEQDLEYVKKIYDYYTLHTTVVYFMHCVTIEELHSFIPINNAGYQSFIIKTEQGIPCGFCYFSRFKPREAFRISVELTIYLEPEHTRHGYGRQVIEQVEPIIRQKGYTNIITLISGENAPSIRLFEQCGYECCANIREVAEKFGRKLDLKMYQKILSRK